MAILEIKDLGLLLEWVCVCSVSKSWQVKSWQLRHWIVCFIGGVDRHIGWVSVDTSVNISAECQLTVVQGSVKYRLSICQRADWVSGYLWAILGPYNLSVDRLSTVGHYFVDGSPTYHQHWVTPWSTVHFQFRPPFNCTNGEAIIHLFLLLDWFC